MQKYESTFYFLFSEQTCNKFKIWEYFNKQLFLITIEQEIFTLATVASRQDITDLIKKKDKTIITSQLNNTSFPIKREKFETLLLPNKIPKSIFYKTENDIKTSHKSLKVISKHKIYLQLPCYSRSVAKSHQDHLYQHHLLTCTAYTIIANHKQIG